MTLWGAGKNAFMRFWYGHVRRMNLVWPSITVHGKRLVIHPEVYKPLENEHICAEYCHEGDRVLDLGCGSGVGAIFCASKAREVVAVDVSSAALENTEENCRLHGVTNVSVVRSDMFSNVPGKFDLILANPPYIEADFPSETQQFATSVRYLPLLFSQMGEHLTGRGRVLIQFPMWFKGRIKKLAAQHGMKVVQVRRMPAKSPGLFLLSVAYMQVGFRSALYLLEPVAVAKPAKASKAAPKASAPRQAKAKAAVPA